MSCLYCLTNLKKDVADCVSSHWNPQAFNDWNKTELDSFLIEITANILKYRDSDGKHLLPKIRDSAGQKGTGKWTAISALEYGTPVTLIGKRKKRCCWRGSIWFPSYSFQRCLLTVNCLSWWHGKRHYATPVHISTWLQQIKGQKAPWSKFWG